MDTGTRSHIYVRRRDIEAPRMSYSGGTSGNVRHFLRHVHDIQRDEEYENVSVGAVSINSRTITVWQRDEQDSWTSDYESVVRYARLKKQEV